MRKLQLIVLLFNIIVLTSCAASDSNNDGGSVSAAATATAAVKTTSITEDNGNSGSEVTKSVQQTTATATATSDSSNNGGSASAAATAKATTVVKTTTTTEDNGNSGSGSTGAGNYNYCKDKYNECSGEDFEITKYRIGTSGFKYFYGIFTSDECNAMLCSPLSPFYELLIIGIFTKKYSATYNQTLEFSGLKNENKIRCVLRLINCLLLSNLPDGVYYSFTENVVSYITFSNYFKYDVKRTLGGTARTCDFDRPKQVQSCVNNDIAEKTDGYVKNTVPCSEPFTKNCTGTKLVIASGHAFESLWERDFELAGKLNYTDMDNKTRVVDSVMQCDTYNYVDSKELDAKVIQLKYKDSIFVITFYVSNKNYVNTSIFTNMLIKLQNETIYSQTMKSLKPEPFRLILPEYGNIQSTVNYVEIFKQQGIMTSLFESGTANIVNACTGQNNKEYISSAFSKGVIKDGIRGVKRNNCNDGNMTEVRVDKPTIFTLSRDDVILFIGFRSLE